LTKKRIRVKENDTGEKKAITPRLESLQVKTF